MRKQILFTISFIILLSLFGYSIPTNDLDSLSKSELEKKKLILEIEKASNEKTDYTYFFQFGTLIAALIAAGISIWSASRSHYIQIESLNSQISQQQKDRISQLLKELGSDQLSVKIASVQALSEYESTHIFLVNLLKIEKDEMLISTVKKVLRKKRLSSLPLLIEETQNIFNSQLSIATSLIAYGNNRKDIASTLGINNGLLSEWISSREGKRLFDHLTKELSFISEPEKEAKCTAETELLIAKWNKTNFSQTQVIDALEELLIESSNKKHTTKIENAYLKGLSLSNLDISGWSFLNCTLIDSEFENCNLTETKFENIVSDNTLFKKCKLQDSVFKDFELKNGDFRNSKGKKITFNNAHFYNCDFSGANLRSSLYENCEFNIVNLQASMFSKSTFAECKFYSCDFTACFFAETKFIKGKIMNCDFQTAKMIKSIFQDSKLYSANIERSSFEEANFSFVEWSNVKIVNSIFTNASFISSKLKRVDFDNITEKTDLKYEDCEIN